jgi:lysyl-tRNA synthetase class 2
MLLSGVDNIREVILFPTMKPEETNSDPHQVKAATGPVIASALGSGTATEEDAPERQAVTRRAEVSTSAGNGGLHPKQAIRTRRLLGAFAGLGGALMLLTLLPVMHSSIDRLGDPMGPLWFRVTGHVVTMLIGLGVLFVAGQLNRGKRRAWQFNVALFGAGVVTNILKGPHPLSVAYCAAMVAALLCYRTLFTAASDRPSLWRLVRLVPVYVGAVLGFGFVSLYLERAHLDHPLTVVGGLRTVGGGLVGMSGPYHYQRPFFADLFPVSLLTLGIAGLIGLAYLLFRPLT